MTGRPFVRSSSACAETRGFTLLEVLIALAILAIAFAASIRSISQAALTLEALHDRTEANMLLSERLDEWQLASDWPAVGRKRQVFLANERDWFWSRQVSSTLDPDMRKLIVRVGLASDGPSEEATLVSRIAYMRRPNATHAASSFNDNP